MTTLQSSYRKLCRVKFPGFQGRGRYMHTFDAAKPIMASGFEDYSRMVTDLLVSAGVTSGKAHMTVDEKTVNAGWSQRRPGPHVDGCFIPALNSWGHDGGGGSGGGWLHTCNDLRIGKPLQRMAVIVAASVAGCRAWSGEFEGQPASDGDLAHIADQLGEGEVLPANVGYLLSPDCVHESLVFDKPTRRQFLRIALEP